MTLLRLIQTQISWWVMTQNWAKHKVVSNLVRFNDSWVQKITHEKLRILPTFCLYFLVFINWGYRHRLGPKSCLYKVDEIQFLFLLLLLLKRVNFLVFMFCNFLGPKCTNIPNSYTTKVLHLTAMSDDCHDFEALTSVKFLNVECYLRYLTDSNFSSPKDS